MSDLEHAEAELRSAARLIESARRGIKEKDQDKAKVRTIEAANRLMAALIHVRNHEVA